MKINFDEKYQRFFNKLNVALDNSNFSLCANLSTDILRVSDTIDFPDGVFIGEFFETLFQNLDYTYKRYIIEDQTIEYLNKEIVNSIQIIKNSFPYNNDANKIEIYNVITNIRAQTTRLQLESLRGEYKTKKSEKKIFSPDLVSLSEDFEQ